MTFKPGVKDEDVQKFRMIEVYVHDLDQKIDGGLMTPQEAVQNLQDKIDEIWNALNPPEPPPPPPEAYTAVKKAAAKNTKHK